MECFNKLRNASAGNVIEYREADFFFLRGPFITAARQLLTGFVANISHPCSLFSDLNLFTPQNRREKFVF